MKYVVVDFRKTDVFTSEFCNKEDAVKEAEYEWGRMTKYEKDKCECFYVLESFNPDEEAENHLDGNVILALK